jgi:glucose-6-phosphate 1-dehydrogenase
MESSHDALKDNTIIVGQCNGLSLSLVIHPDDHRSPRRIGRSCQEEGASKPSARRSRVRWLTPHLQTFPALFGLFRQGFLPRDVKIVGYARTKMDKAEYHKRATSYLKNPNDDPEITQAIEKFKSISTYVSGSYDEGEAFAALNAHLEEIESHYASKEANRLFYFALPPSVFVPVAKNLREQCYVATGINRVIVEKPFGKDTASAAELLKSLKEYWTEDETFRIDHYLGKEMVKNLLVLRFANIALGAAWDKNYISNVQITFKEPFGTEGRGGYFDEFGMIRDVLQNRKPYLHLPVTLTQLLYRFVASSQHFDNGASRLVFR